MGFQTPQHNVTKYLEWTTSGSIQLPDFQRSYRWKDEGIRQLLITVLRGHPMGVVMLLDTKNDEVRFKPRLITGVRLSTETSPDYLLLDGQQRLTSMTQALTGDGVVETSDDRGKLLSRRYFVHIETALLGEERVDEAVISVPADGKIKTNFDREVLLDLSTPAQQQEHGYFPLNLLFSPTESTDWLIDLGNTELFKRFNAEVISPASQYELPAILLDRNTSKEAVATVFEKVNTGGEPLTAFELLTATFAGDREYYEANGQDFRLREDWAETCRQFEQYPVLRQITSTHFLQAVTLLASRKKHLSDVGSRPTAITAKTEDVLKLKLADYLEWVGPLREAFQWAARFCMDRHIFDASLLPYPTQLIPLAAIRVVLGPDADLLGPRTQIIRWFWSGVLGELYGSTTETRFVSDIRQVPEWAMDPDNAVTPRTIQDATFTESRLHSLRSRVSAAYKGVSALLLAEQARDWMEDKSFDKIQHSELQADIHHIFPKKWCAEHDVDREHQESIVNKTTISARTNRSIGGHPPSSYLAKIERTAQITSEHLDQRLASHLISGAHLRRDDFEAFFEDRRERFCAMIGEAMGKEVHRDIQLRTALEDSSKFADEAPEDRGVAETVEASV